MKMNKKLMLKNILSKHEVDKILPTSQLKGNIFFESGYGFCDLKPYSVEFYNVIQHLKRNTSFYGYEDTTKNLHASIIYPEEIKNITMQTDMIAECNLFTKNVVEISLHGKLYVVLLVNSDDILSFRRNNNLPDKLLFRNSIVPLHITIMKRTIL